MIEFHELALAEARQAQRWYAERSGRAAARFRLELVKAVEQIGNAATRFAFLRAN